MFDTSNIGSLTQTLSDGSASLHYAVGGNAYNLFIKNRNSLSDYVSFDENDNSIYFTNDSISRLGYTDDGVAWTTNKTVNGGDGLFCLLFNRNRSSF